MQIKKIIAAIVLIGFLSTSSPTKADGELMNLVIPPVAAIISGGILPHSTGMSLTHFCGVAAFMIAGLGTLINAGFGLHCLFFPDNDREKRYGIPFIASAALTGYLLNKQLSH